MAGPARTQNSTRHNLATSCTEGRFPERPTDAGRKFLVPGGKRIREKVVAGPMEGKGEREDPTLTGGVARGESELVRK